MAATAVVLRKEVTDDLNKKKGTWATTFQAEERYQPKFNFEETDQLQVQTCLMLWRFIKSSRGFWLDEFVIGVGLHYRAKATSGDQAKAKFDELLKLVEDITGYYMTILKTAVADCSLENIEMGGGTGLPYAHEVIETQNQFTSVIHLTFRKER